MEQGEILCQMLQTLGEALGAAESRARREALYERQREYYHLLCRAPAGEENDRRLICARCLVSASRSLVASAPESRQSCRPDVQKLRASVLRQLRALWQQQDPVSESAVIRCFCLSQAVQDGGRERI